MTSQTPRSRCARSRRAMARLAGPVLALLLGLPAPPALAGSFAQSLVFTAGNQSLWGPGKTASSFGASGSASLPSTFFTPELGASYKLTASAGTVSGTLGGVLSATYADQLSAPGTTSVQLGFGGLTGTVSTALGARADLKGYIHDVPFFGPWDFCIYCKNYALDTNISLSAASFGTQESASDRFSVAGVGPDIVVASAQASLDATQSSRFTPDSITGTLRYTHQGTGTTRTSPFSLAGLSVLSADLDLPGWWDFELLALDVANTFRASVGAGLSLNVDLIGVIEKTWPFANLDLLDTGAFALDFGAKNVLSAFSIQVVPEPGTLLLLGAGLAGLGALGRTRRV